MRKTILFFSISLIFTSLISCKKDDAVSCITCTSSVTLPFELCQEADGNASVNGENTGIPYDQYLAGLRESDTNCDNN